MLERKAELVHGVGRNPNALLEISKPLRAEPPPKPHPNGMAPCGKVEKEQTPFAIPTSLPTLSGVSSTRGYRPAALSDVISSGPAVPSPFQEFGSFQLLKLSSQPMVIIPGFKGLEDVRWSRPRQEIKAPDEQGEQIFGFGGSLHDG